MKELRKLSDVILNPKPDSWQVLEDEFSKVEGLTNPGLDQPSSIFSVVYHPDYISQEQILSKLLALGYEYADPKK